MADTSIVAAQAVAGSPEATGRGRTRRWSLRRFRSAASMVAAFGIALGAWQFASTYLIDPHLIPPPTAVARAAVPMFRSGEIIGDISISVLRVLIGFSIGSLLAIVAGVVMGRLRVVYELVDPIVELLRYLSPTAMIPIAVIWFGIGEMSKYFLIFWGSFFFVLINTIAGVVRTPLARERAARCLGANGFQVFLLVVVPSAVPYIVTGMRIAMATSLMSIIPAEMLAADSGLGYLLQTAGMLVQTDRIFVALVTISIIGFVLDRLFRILVNRTLSRYMANVTAA
jgi:NitT/TauT family transport system permease protein/taurine transport system permease protein